jgi:hypothetical protein
MQRIAGRRELAVSFALVAGAGALLMASAGHRLVSVLACTVIGAVSGAAIGRSSGPDVPLARAAAYAAWISTAASVVAALVVGGSCTALGGARGLTFGALEVTAAFGPIAVLLLFGARRIATTRASSLARGVEQRRLWRTVAAIIAVLSLARLADWPASRGGSLQPPRLALAVAIAAASAIVVLIAAEQRERRRLTRLASFSGAMDPASADDRDVSRDATIDLGFGNAALAMRAASPGAYRRGRDRAVLLLVGSLEAARDALGHATRGGVAALAIAAGTLLAHALAASTDGAIAYHRVRCDGGRDKLGASCAVVASLLQQKGDLSGAASFHKTACYDGIEASCDWLHALVEPSRRAYESSCEWGDVASCRALASLLTGGSTSFPAFQGDIGRAERLLRRACSSGSGESCDDADRIAAHRDHCLRHPDGFRCADVERDRGKP